MPQEGISHLSQDGAYNSLCINVLSMPAKVISERVLVSWVHEHLKPLKYVILALLYPKEKLYQSMSHFISLIFLEDSPIKHLGKKRNLTCAFYKMNCRVWAHGMAESIDVVAMSFLSTGNLILMAIRENCRCTPAQESRIFMPATHED